jgi:hypothetical protein
MSKEQAEKMAAEFILKHKQNFRKGKGRATKQQIDAAIRSVAREIKNLSVKSATA